jgi:hypothetical protein
MKDGGPTRGDLSPILQDPYEATRDPTDRAFNERIKVSRENLLDVGRILYLLLQDLSYLLSLEPLIGVCADQTNPLVTRGVTLYQGGVSAGESLKPSEHTIAQFS